MRRTNFYLIIGFLALTFSNAYAEEKTTSPEAKLSEATTQINPEKKVESKEPDYKRLLNRNLLFLDDDSSWFEGSFGYRSKTGDSGLSKLEEWTQPGALGHLVLNKDDTMEFSLRHFNLDSQDLRSGALIGHFPTVVTPWSFSPTTRLDDLFEPQVSYRHDGETAYIMELGTTPLNAPISPLPEGRLIGTFHQKDGGYLQFETFANSKKESILSYTGIVDPYTGQKWGRVEETGGKIISYVPLDKDWSFYGQLKGAWILGDHVEDNQNAELAWSIGHNFSVPYFSYFTLGPTFSADYFAKNLSQFTFGQGGYFSPRYLVQGGLALNCLTKQTEFLMMRNYAFAGVQKHENGSSPLFPLADDGRRYGYDQNSSFLFTYSAELLFRLSDSVHWLNQATYNKSSDYTEWMASTSFRFLFGD